MNIATFSTLKGLCKICETELPLDIVSYEYLHGIREYEMYGILFRINCKQCNEQTHIRESKMPNRDEVHRVAIWTCRIVRQTLDEFSEILYDNGIEEQDGWWDDM